jgi:hypothetical protein
MATRLIGDQRLMMLLADWSSWKWLVVAAGCGTLFNACGCGGIVSPPANEQWDEREGLAQSGFKSKSSLRLPLSRFANKFHRQHNTSGCS